MLSTKSWMHSIHPTIKLKYHLANLGAQPPLRDGRGGVWEGTSCCPPDSGLWAVSFNSERPGNTWGQEAVSLFLSAHTWEGGGGGPRWPFRSGGRCARKGEPCADPAVAAPRRSAPGRRGPRSRPLPWASGENSPCSRYGHRDPGRPQPAV